MMAWLRPARATASKMHHRSPINRIYDSSWPSMLDYFHALTAPPLSEVPRPAENNIDEQSSRAMLASSVGGQHRLDDFRGRA